MALDGIELDSSLRPKVGCFEALHSEMILDLHVESSL